MAALHAKGRHGISPHPSEVALSPLGGRFLSRLSATHMRWQLAVRHLGAALILLLTCDCVVTTHQGSGGGDAPRTRLHILAHRGDAPTPSVVSTEPVRHRRDGHGRGVVRCDEHQSHVSDDLLGSVPGIVASLNTAYPALERLRTTAATAA